jgi:hypothetical protein
MEIRLATPADLAQVHDIWYQAEVALCHPGALSLGPIGARSVTLALDCTLAAVACAAEQAPALALGVPAAHPCLPVLLEAGFRMM